MTLIDYQTKSHSKLLKNKGLKISGNLKLFRGQTAKELRVRLEILFSSKISKRCERCTKLKINLAFPGQISAVIIRFSSVLPTM